MEKACWDQLMLSVLCSEIIEATQHRGHLYLMRHWPSGYEVLSRIRNELWQKTETETNSQGLDEIARVSCQAPCSSWQHSHVCKEGKMVTERSSPLPLMLKWVCQVWYLIFPKSCSFWFGFWLCSREGLILLSGYSGTFYVSQAGPIVLASLSTMSPGKQCTPMPRLPYSSVNKKVSESCPSLDCIQWLVCDQWNVVRIIKTLSRGNLPLNQEFPAPSWHTNYLNRGSQDARSQLCHHAKSCRQKQSLKSCL